MGLVAPCHHLWSLLHIRRQVGQPPTTRTQRHVVTHLSSLLPRLLPQSWLLSDCTLDITSLDLQVSMMFCSLPVMYPPDRATYIRLAVWLIEFFFLLGTACTKISILLVYRKISSGSHTLWFIRLTWAAVAFTVMYTVALILEISLVCRPLDSYWNSYSPTYSKNSPVAMNAFPLCCVSNKSRP
jgi:hypothetical protein